MNVQSGDTYNIPGHSFIAIENEVQPMFAGNAALEGANRHTIYSVDYMQVIWQGLDNINSLFEDIADTVTVVLRNTGNITTANVYIDTVYTTETIVQVRWPCLIGPIYIVLLSTVYLLAGIIQTRSSGVGAWKSSPLVTLFMTPEALMRQGIRDDMTTSDELQVMVGEQRVKLELRDQGDWVCRPA
jgi:hypothetical protein